MGLASERGQKNTRTHTDCWRKGRARSLARKDGRAGARGKEGCRTTDCRRGTLAGLACWRGERGLPDGGHGLRDQRGPTPGGVGGHCWLGWLSSTLGWRTELLGISGAPSSRFPPLFLGTGTTRNRSSRGLTFVCLMAPLLTTWQDHMRRAGDVCHAQTNRDGTGEVEFSTYEDMKYAVC